MTGCFVDLCLLLDQRYKDTELLNFMYAKCDLLLLLLFYIFIYNNCF